MHSMRQRRLATTIAVNKPLDVLLDEHALHRRLLAVFERIARSIDAGAAFPAADVAVVLGYLREFVERLHHQK